MFQWASLSGCSWRVSNPDVLRFDPARCVAKILEMKTVENNRGIEGAGAALSQAKLNEQYHRASVDGRGRWPA